MSILNKISFWDRGVFCYVKISITNWIDRSDKYLPIWVASVALSQEHTVYSIVFIKLYLRGALIVTKLNIVKHNLQP